VPHELSEHIEHAGHEPGHQGGGLARYIGLTIAMLGVLMAVCAAEVGAARTELIATMVNENGAKGEYQTVSTKYRTLQAVLQHLHASMPDLELMVKTDKELEPITSSVKNSNSESAHGIRVTRLETKKVLSAVIPTGEDVLSLIKLVEGYEEQAEAAKEWSESYHDAIKVHESSAKYFEIAQVAAEIAIVIASVGLLLSAQKMFARGAWVVAIVLGVTSMTLFGGTFSINYMRLHNAEHKIEESLEHYKGMIAKHDDVKNDHELIEQTKKAVQELEKLMSQQ
jgi:hypothetical protein